MNSHLLDITNLERFLFAGNATLTLESKASSKRFTFNVQQALSDGKPNGRYFVRLLNGPDSYAYMGMLEPNRSFHTTPKSKVTNRAESFKAFTWFIQHLTSERLTQQANIYHAGKCGRCGRELTVPESILSGLGPECSKKVGF